MSTQLSVSLDGRLDGRVHAVAVSCTFPYGLDVPRDEATAAIEEFRRNLLALVEKYDPTKERE